MLSSLINNMNDDLRDSYRKQKRLYQRKVKLQVFAASAVLLIAAVALVIAVGWSFAPQLLPQKREVTLDSWNKSGLLIDRSLDKMRPVPKCNSPEPMVLYRCYSHTKNYRLFQLSALFDETSSSLALISRSPRQSCALAAGRAANKFNILVQLFFSNINSQAKLASSGDGLSKLVSHAGKYKEGLKRFQRARRILVKNCRPNNPAGTKKGGQ